MPQCQAQNQCGDDGNFVGLEDVRRHTGAVAHIVTHEVGDHSRVARIVFGDTGFNFAHEVGAHISGFGVNAAAHAHEKGNERRAKAKTKQGIRRGNAENDEDDGAAQQAKPIREHAGNCARAVGYAKRIAEGTPRRRRNAHIPLNCHTHTDLPNRQRKQRAQNKSTGAPQTHNELHGAFTHAGKLLHCFFRNRHNVNREKEQNCERHNEGHDYLGLAVQISNCAFTNCAPNFLHLFGALVFAQNLRPQEEGISKP